MIHLTTIFKAGQKLHPSLYVEDANCLRKFVNSGSKFSPGNCQIVILQLWKTVIFTYLSYFFTLLFENFNYLEGEISKELRK